MRRLPIRLSLTILVTVASLVMGRQTTAAQDATPAPARSRDLSRSSMAPRRHLLPGKPPVRAASNWSTGPSLPAPVRRSSPSLGCSTTRRAPLPIMCCASRFRVTDPADNSGVFVRFRDPLAPLPEEELSGPDADRLYPNRDSYAVNGMWIAADTGFEVAIEDAAADNPTGAIYDIPVGGGSGQQDFQHGRALVPGNGMTWRSRSWAIPTRSA